MVEIKENITQELEVETTSDQASELMLDSMPTRQKKNLTLIVIAGMILFLIAGINVAALMLGSGLIGQLLTASLIVVMLCAFRLSAILSRDEINNNVFQ